MNKFIKPDWENSNLNISATLAEFLGAENKNKTLKILNDELEKGYKNVVFICLDGFGINPININLDENALLRKNIKQVLTSTFPSTTTNATTKERYGEAFFTIVNTKNTTNAKITDSIEISFPPRIFTKLFLVFSHFPIIYFSF